MDNKRDKLIKSALMAKLSDGFDMYTADDILTMADITETERQEFYDKIKSEIEKLAMKKKN